MSLCLIVPGRTTSLLVGMAILSIVSASCLNSITGGHSIGELGLTRPSQEKPLPEWIGKDRKELREKMGEPRNQVTEDSGAYELYYSFEGHQYFFETDIKGKIKTAVQID